MPRNLRRTLLSSGAALLTGLAGAGFVGRHLGHAGPAAASAAADPAATILAGPVDGAAIMPEPRTIELRWFGQSWQLQSDAPRATWARPARGQRSLIYGELLDAPADQGGSKVGELYATCTCVNAPFGDGPTAATSLEQHTINLLDGSLTGMGTSQGEDGTFAIVGGTGRYAGARGSYTARQSPVGIGGDGTAEFVVTLIAEDA